MAPSLAAVREDQPFPIPVRVVGPGSQPADDAVLDVMPLPRELSAFEMPHVPERVGAATMLESAAALQRLLDAMAAHSADGDGPCIALDDLSPAALEVTNQVLGDGEVSIRVAASAARPAVDVQESVFAGIWRCGERNADGALARYWLEAGTVPRAVREAAQDADGAVQDPKPWPTGAMNSPALLAELRARLAAGETRGQINLTLLPLTPEDRRVLDAALPPGPVAVLSRGFGHCQVASTAVRGVWRVQFFNSMNTPILETIEIAVLPEAVAAAADDLAASRERLADLLRWMRESAADESS